MENRIERNTDSVKNILLGLPSHIFQETGVDPLTQH